MPYCRIAKSSVLLSPGGWTRAERLVDRAQVVGLDRFGRQLTQDVSVSVNTEVFGTFYLGTRAAFGAFHPDTLLVSADGTRRSIKSIILAQTLNEIRFENICELAEPLNVERAVVSIWNELCRASIIVADGQAIFKASRHASNLHAELGWGCFLVKERVTYLVVEHRLLIAALETNWLETLSLLLKLLFLNEDNTLEVERDCYPLLLWCALGMNSVGTTFRFVFDSIQHSASVAISLAQSSGTVERLRTSFTAGVTTTVRVQWVDNQWNPIVSGFIVSGE